MAEKEHEDLTCTVCLEEFKVPKILPCCHTLCKGCLEHILEKSGQKENLICPQCRAEHHVPVVAFQKNHTGQAIPVGGPDAFLSDFTVLRSLTTKRESCGMCTSKEMIPPVSFCKECEEYLCEYCNGAHKRMKVFIDHKVVALNEFKLESFCPKSKPYYCQQHTQNIVRFFCQTCNQLVCENCVVHSQNQLTDNVVKHNTHIVATLSDGLKPMEREFKELLHSADHDCKSYESSLNSLEAIEIQRELYTQQLKAQVNTAVDLYIKCLQASRVRTLKEIDANSSEQGKYNQTQKQHLQTTVTRMNSGLKFGLKALQCHNDTERVAMIGQAMSQLKQPDLPHSVSINFEKRLESPLVVKDLKLTLQTLLQEFQSSDIHLLGNDSFHPHAVLGKKSQLKVTIRLKPIGNPQFLIKYGTYYQCSLTPQTTHTWLLEFTPCCGGRHAVSACIYGHWIMCSASESAGVPTFYVRGSLKEGDIVRRVPDQSGSPLKAKETGKVTHSQPEYGKPLEVRVKWTEGEEESEGSFQWGNPSSYPRSHINQRH